MNLARSYRAMMEQDAIQFSPSHQKLLLETCLSLPASYEITVRAVAVVDNHVHLIVSWANGRSLSTIKHLLKSILTDRLNRSEGRINGKWFSRGSGDTKIVDIDHLIELVKSYLPEHGEKVWIEPGILARW